MKTPEAFYGNVPITKGMQATQCVGSDCYPYEVVEIVSKTRVAVRAMLCERTSMNNGYSENQTYEYSSDHDGIPIIAKMGTKGKWKVGSLPLHFGHARYYQDPHF